MAHAENHYHYYNEKKNTGKNINSITKYRLRSFPSSDIRIRNTKILPPDSHGTLPFKYVPT